MPEKSRVSTEEYSSTYTNYVLFILVLNYVSDLWSRHVLNYLYAVDADVDDRTYISVSYDTDLSATEYGLLIGYGFSGTFVVVGILMGRAADIYNRRNIIFMGCMVWNVALALMGRCNNFWQLLLTRLLLGVGQALCAPASYSMIADYFPVGKRANANGIYASGVYIGSGAASISMIIADSIGWRNTSYATAAFGIFCGFLLFTVKEPRRAKGKDIKKGEGNDMSMQDTIRIIFKESQVKFLLAAAGTRYMAGYTITGFLPYMYNAEFPEYSAQYSIANAVICVTAGFFSSYAGGKLSEVWLAAGEPKAEFNVMIIGCLLGCPFMVICCLAQNFSVSVFVGLLGQTIFSECWFGPYVSVLQKNIPPEACAMSVAVVIFIGTFSGSLSTLLIGQLYDRLLEFGYDEACVKYIVLYATVIPYLASAVLFYLASTVTMKETFTCHKFSKSLCQKWASSTTEHARLIRSSSHQDLERRGDEISSPATVYI